MFSRNKINEFLVIVFTLVSFITFGQDTSKLKVVLDPGHGGKDKGTVWHNFVEKKIALNVALKLGGILQKKPNIEVIYTRKTDIFVDLKERAAIANKEKANIFVSIHCNSVPKIQAYGTETFVMGLTKNASNLEVAKRENEVITLESDYKLKYSGFDPNTPESMVGIKLLQEEYIDQSIVLASKVQEQFNTSLKRKDRGVKQGPILVLNQSAMPSILIELGFLSYKSEGEYLNSNKGQDELANAIANAIISYQKNYFGSTSNVANESVEKKDSVQKQTIKKETPKVASKTVELNKKFVDKTKIPDKIAVPQGIVFKIQIEAGITKKEMKSSNFKGLENVSFYFEKKLYKYTYGYTADYNKAKNYLKIVQEKGYKDAFIIAFKNENKISIQEALK